ncbi:vitamin B12 dependent-methionine synthase activation domain-containing protein [Lutispora sp.]|uniref:vitamin B12 dependent-methionine synthase activation domain-containing protein n=1 Tax=Lutispora sp. TaxID=2828727 RepID=UPI002B21CB0E|nr:vitamin B12 dependent-methionine synthase activation domain-containing protein [Lutispora sp.]MEA4961813.1 vitamin B12 dependent-methionine synthase activation domain-containing protein [Lutispora sp.]
MHINRKEVLRYLGHKNQYMDEKLEKLLTECIAEMTEALRKSFVYNVYDIERDGDKMALKDTNLIFQSKDLTMHFRNSDKCALMAATLGLEADRRIAYYSKTDLTKGIVMDACASAAIEALCDEVQEEIRIEALKEGYCCTSRYSPGYGDLPITLQKGIIELLKAYPRIGLTVNESSIMLPRKSVTAFIGWQRQESTSEGNKCSRCKDRNCIYRKCGDIND